MNLNESDWRAIEANWQQLRGAAEKRWPRLSPATLDRTGGSREALIAQLRKEYHVTDDEAAEQLDAFADENADYLSREDRPGATTPWSPHP